MGESSKLSKIEERVAALSGVSDEELLRRFEVLLETALDSLREMAAILKVIESRGGIVELQLATLPYIRKMAYGNLLPELFIATAGKKGLLSKAANLPIPDQALIASNKPIKVWSIDGDHRLVEPMNMTTGQICQVFGDGHICGESEQVNYLRVKQEKAKLREVVADGDEIVADRKRNGWVIRGLFISAHDMGRMLADLAEHKRRAG